MKKKLTIIAAAATILLVASSFVFLFTAEVERISATQIWAYDSQGRPVANHPLTIEIQRIAGEGPWREANHASTDATGRVSLQRDVTRRFTIPPGLPNAIGQRIVSRSSGLVVPGGARHLQMLIDPSQGTRYSLTFSSGDNRLDRQGSYGAACAARMDRLASAEPWLLRTSHPDFAREIRDAITQRALALGMEPISESGDPGTLDFQACENRDLHTSVALTVTLRGSDGSPITPVAAAPQSASR